MSVRATNNLGAILGKLESGLPAVVETATTGIKTAIQTAMHSSPASGRTYHRRGRTHQASSPGEAPAVDTGGLVGGIATQNAGTSGMVTIPGPAAFLELGTRKLSPRPFVANGVRDALPAVEAALSELVGQ